MSQENVEVVRRGSKRSTEATSMVLSELLAPDFEYVASGLVPGVGGVYRGPRD